MGAYEDCRIVRTTEKAVLFEYQTETYWVPKSQMAKDFARHPAGTEGVTLSITEWIREKSMIPFPDDD